jgi:hypothetical protein
MTRYRFRIQQLTLTIKSTLHPKIIPNNTAEEFDRYADSQDTPRASTQLAFPTARARSRPARPR